MASLDIFNSDAFTMQSLTTAINKAPYKPKLLGGLGLFSPNPVRTTKVFIEERNNTLRILNTANRGTMKDVRDVASRKATGFEVPHVPYFQTVLADDIQNIRAFGSESELEAIASHVNDQLVGMRDDHETTHEYHRVGALKGTVLDGDASTTIYNFYTEFGTSQQTSDFVFTITDFGAVTADVIRKIGTALGNDTFDTILAICGNTYFDKVVAHTSNKDAYDRWRDGEWKRMSYLGPQWYAAAANGFMLHNIMFINYRGVIGDVTFIPDTEAYYTPVGIPGMFQEIIAPADFMETVNTRGQLIYAKQERMKFDKGVELHTQSNVLCMNTRPRAVIKSTYSAS